jgi:hypothetical protein
MIAASFISEFHPLFRQRFYVNFAYLLPTYSQKARRDLSLFQINKVRMDD